MASPTPAVTPSPWLTASPLPPLDMAAQPDLPIWPYLIQLGIVTGIVCALGYFGLKFLREKVPAIGLQLGGVGGGRNLRVVERVMVDPARAVFVVAVGKRYWLLAATNEHVTPIAELAREDVEAGEFADLVEKERTRRDAP